MEEKNARWLALACSVAGLLLLFIYSSAAEQGAAPSNISGITFDDVGSSFKVCGNATSVRVNNGHIFLQADDETGRISIVIFNTTAARINRSAPVYSLRTGDYFCAMGQLEEYPPGTGQLEIQAKSVVL